MSEFTDELLADAKQRMAKSVESCRHELATVRTGRASPHLLDRVVVDYYGTETPLRQLSQIAATDARLLTLTPYDKNAIKAIEKSILESDLGSPRPTMAMSSASRSRSSTRSDAATWSRSSTTWPRKAGSLSAISVATSCTTFGS